MQSKALPPSSSEYDPIVVEFAVGPTSYSGTYMVMEQSVVDGINKAPRSLTVSFGK